VWSGYENLVAGPAKCLRERDERAEVTGSAAGGEEYAHPRLTTPAGRRLFRGAAV
jgi:hypothetical protein